MPDSGPRGENPLQKALRIVLAMLPHDQDATATEVAFACQTVCSMLATQGETVELAALQREAEARVTVWQEESTGLQDSTNHVEWLPVARGERSWDFWDRYRRFLEEMKLMPKKVVWRLDASTDQVLRQLEDPAGPDGGTGKGWSSDRSSRGRPPTTSA